MDSKRYRRVLVRVCIIIDQFSSHSAYNLIMVLVDNFIIVLVYNFMMEKC